MNQFAYRCLVAFLLLIDQWKWAIDSTSITVAAFLDLRKAFDVINHGIVLSKLNKAGITGISYNWFKTYLTNDLIIWIDCSKVMSDKLERLQNQALRSILKNNRKTCTQWMRQKCHLLSLKDRRRFLRFQLVLRLLNVTTAPYT